MALVAAVAHGQVASVETADDVAVPSSVTAEDLQGADGADLDGEETYFFNSYRRPYYGSVGRAGSPGRQGRFHQSRLHSTHEFYMN